MTRAALLTLSVFALLTTPSFAQVAGNATDDAIAESVRREAFKLELQRKLADAQNAEKRGENLAAARLYEDALQLIKKIGPGVEKDYRQVLAGMTVVRLRLGAQAQRRADFAEADAQAARILKEDPKNAAALAFRTENDKLRGETVGKMPSEDTLRQLPRAVEDKIRANTLVQNGKVLFETGKYEQAEGQLMQAVRIDPGNKAAYYYLDLIKDQRYRDESAARESWSKQMMLDVAKAWNDPVRREALAVPNPYAQTNIVYTGKGRQAIYSKLDRIRLDSVTYDGLPLGEVIKALAAEAQRRDPDKEGVNFLINANIDPAAAGPGAIDPATGLPAAAGAGEPVDLSATTIKIVPPLNRITLRQALDAIQKVADKPIKYSVEDYAIIFSPKTAETPLLHTRTFKVDPNTFVQGLQGVIAQTFGTSGGGGGGGGVGGGGGGRGGGRGGGGGGRGGGGFGGGGQGGVGGQGGQNAISGSEYIGVSLAPGGAAGRAGQAGGQAARPGAAGRAGGAAGQQGGGIRSLTQETETQDLSDIVRAYFTTAGVDLSPPKSIFFNDRSGMLMVRAELKDLDIVEQAIQVLNILPPQLTIEAKFAEVTQDDTRALGFDWFLGNTLISGGRMGVQGGTAPTFGGVAAASAANPSGFFPGPGVPPSPNLPSPANVQGAAGPFAIFPQATDNILTSGLRNTAPAIATYTGILTDPQFRVVIKALEQRQGVDLLSAPKITTMSARQAQIKVVDVRYIVTDLDLSQTAGGGSFGTTVGGTATPGGVGSAIQPIAEPIELGPVLDVVPYVSADGFTIQMTIIPTIKEFVGYDLDTAKLFQAQAQGVGGPATGLTQQTPLPIFRLRQVVTSAVVWDGQTVVLGGLISENVTKTKDKVPLLGDLPIAGRLFRSESSQTKKKNLLIFVTPTIIDPAGNRVHTDEDLPFAQQTLPSQRPVTQ